MARISAILFTLAPPRDAPPFLARGSGAVPLKMAQVPSTAVLIGLRLSVLKFLK